ncbi:MAG: prepilin-type N-terminal cleavage/methylation domain-containing protein [Candidatus Omnitrophica bacterium]|nr:prepilin-type N-terminal cleavage/methylation domain-containing protein [Candidatus Omnitrophota bacterium]
MYDNKGKKAFILLERCINNTKNNSQMGFTLMEIMMVVSIISIVSAVSIPNLLRSKITANESTAKATLKTISTACEMFLAANGEYPLAESDLTDVTPPYLTRNYDGQTIQGYTYAYLDLNGDGYTVMAAATPCGRMGSNNYAVVTGAVLTSESCVNP